MFYFSTKHLPMFWDLWGQFPFNNPSSIFLKSTPPHMHRLYAVVRGDLQIIVFPELERGSQG